MHRRAIGETLARTPDAHLYQDLARREPELLQEQAVHVADGQARTRRHGLHRDGVAQRCPEQDERPGYACVAHLALEVDGLQRSAQGRCGQAFGERRDQRERERPRMRHVRMQQQVEDQLLHELARRQDRDAARSTTAFPPHVVIDHGNEALPGALTCSQAVLDIGRHVEHAPRPARVRLTLDRAIDLPLQGDEHDVFGPRVAPNAHRGFVVVDEVQPGQPYGDVLSALHRTRV